MRWSTNKTNFGNKQDVIYGSRKNSERTWCLFSRATQKVHKNNKLLAHLTKKSIILFHVIYHLADVFFPHSACKELGVLGGAGGCVTQMTFIMCLCTQQATNNKTRHMGCKMYQSENKIETGPFWNPNRSNYEMQRPWDAVYEELDKINVISTHQLTKMLHCIVQHSRRCFWLLQFIVDAVRHYKNKDKLVNVKVEKTETGGILGSLLPVSDGSVVGKL